MLATRASSGVGCSRNSRNLSVASSRSLRAAGYGASARKRAEAEFSRAAMTRRFEEFYRGLVG